MKKNARVQTQDNELYDKSEVLVLRRVHTPEDALNDIKNAEQEDKSVEGHGLRVQTQEQKLGNDGSMCSADRSLLLNSVIAVRAPRAFAELVH